MQPNLYETIMPKRKSGGRRRRRGRKASGVVSTVVTLVTTVAGNTVSAKTLTLPQLIPDIGVNRDLVVNKIVVKIIPAGTNPNAGALAQIGLLGDPWQTGPDAFVSQQWRTLSNVNPTSLSVVPLPASKVSISPDRNGAALQIKVSSLFGASFQVVCNTHYRMLADGTITAYA